MTIRWTHTEDSYSCGSRPENNFLDRIIEVIEGYMAAEVISVYMEKRKHGKLTS